MTVVADENDSDEEKKPKLDYLDQGEVDLKGGERLKIHGYFDDFLKEKYFVLSEDGLNFEDFYIMSEQFFTTKGLPVLFHDILYNLIGNVYAVADT